MLLVRQRVDRRHAGELRELLDVGLRKRPNDGAVDHPRENAGRVLDQLAAPELNVVRVQENRFTAQFAHAHFERDSRPRRRLRKDQTPGLPAQRKLRVLPAILFLQGRDVEDVVHLRPVQFLDAKKIFHGR